MIGGGRLSPAGMWNSIASLLLLISQPHSLTAVAVAKGAISMRDICAAAAMLAAALLTFGPASAQQLTAEDFVKKVVISDMFEVQSSRLAADQAENDDVQSFGEKMVNDHTKTSDELLGLVKNEDIKVEVPKALDKDHQAKLDNLTGLSGRKFDQAYVPMQVKAHETAVDLFDRYSKNGDNDKLKEWAEETLPHLKDHLEQAKALNEEIKSAPETAARDDDKDAKASRDKDRQAAMDEDKGSDIKFVTRQQPSDWSAAALIGRTVENGQGDNLGEINNVVLNEKGAVVAVTIGVGGFLGIGEKDIGVPFEALEFRPKDAAADQPDAKKDEQNAASRFDTEHEDTRIVLRATQEQLEKAPQFVWLDEQDTESAGGGREIR
jgi:putative membrane protein